MNLERTLSIIKPDAISKSIVGQIISRFEKNNLYVIALKMIFMNSFVASGFYIEHKNKPFYKNLINFMISGPIIVQILEGENAILKNRELMGDTDPFKARMGTLRSDFSKSILQNIIHGSDSLESSIREINYFFDITEIFIF